MTTELLSRVEEEAAFSFALFFYSMKVEHWDAERDGKLSTHALRRKLEELGYSVSSYTYSPGTYFPPHTHAVDKIDAVLSGRFLISMGDQFVVLEAGDFIYVPKGAAHSAEVVGDEPVVSLDGAKSR
ncbi:MAG: cupin domain-containing protein [Acidobacteriales bacterium]|nr:cupin domain-containing protein [Terriglobales bacterium]